MSKPTEYLVDKDGNFHLPSTVTSYLARAGIAGNFTVWDPKVGAWKRDTHFYLEDREATPEQVEESAKLLPLRVPGLKVVKTGLTKFKKWDGRNQNQGHVWFSWTRHDEDMRLQEIFEKHGAAYHELEYMMCGGENLSPEGQLRLPGVVEVQPRGTYFSSPGAYFSATLTSHGLRQIDGAFCQRICHPNMGGVNAYPGMDRCVVGGEWWFVGSRGDSEEILALEIQGSPLDDRTKENLLDNLKNYPRNASVRVPRDDPFGS